MRGVVFDYKNYISSKLTTTVTVTMTMTRIRTNGPKNVFKKNRITYSGNALSKYNKRKSVVPNVSRKKDANASKSEPTL